MRTVTESLIVAAVACCVSHASEASASCTSYTKVDSNNTSSGFGNGTYFGTTWDAAGYIKLDPAGVPANTSELAASWTPQWASLVGHWKLNGAGGIANGAAVTGAVGTSGTAGNADGYGMSYATGQLNAGIRFDGVDDYVRVSDSAAYSSMTQITMAGWVYVSAYPASGQQAQIIGKSVTALDAASASPFALWSLAVQSNGTLVAGVASNATRTLWTSNGVVTLDQWHHVAVTYDGATLRGYVDGAADSSTASASVVIGSNAVPPIIGAYRASGNAGQFIGSIDELAVWNKALTAGEITTLYARQSPSFTPTYTSPVVDMNSVSVSFLGLGWTSTLPAMKELPDCTGGVQNESTSAYSSLASSALMTSIAGLWHLNETAAATGPGGTDFTDASGSGAHGTAHGGVGYGVNRKLGNAATLGGYITLGDGIDSTFIGPNKQFTIAAWIKPGETMTASVIVGKWANSTPNQKAFYFSLDTGSRLHLMWAGTPGGVSYRGTLGTTPITNRAVWYHVAAVYDGTISDVDARVSLYVNGVADATSISASHGNPMKIPNTSAPVTVGAFATDTGDNDGSNFSGSIDEVAIWARGLSATELQQLYRRGANRLEFQVRSCAQADCSDGTWLGPDGTALTYFSELNNNTLPTSCGGSVQSSAPVMTFSDFAGLPSIANRYIQYRATFETDDALANGPQLQSVSSALSVCTTATHLTSFKVSARGAAARVEWSAAPTSDNLAWNVYRGLPGDNAPQRARINSAAFDGTWTGRGGTYEYIDSSYEPGDVYWLAETDLAGEVAWHGPVAPAASEYTRLKGWHVGDGTARAPAPLFGYGCNVHTSDRGAPWGALAGLGLVAAARRRRASRSPA